MAKIGTKLAKKYRVADIGYGYLKFLTDEGIVEKESAIVAELGNQQDSGRPGNNDSITVDGVEYVVGNDVYRLGLTPITASESSNRADNIAYKVLGLYSLARMHESDKDTITFLTGLPYQNFKNPEEVAAVKQLFQGVHVVEYNGKELNIDIEEVLVVSQGIGTYFSLSAQRAKDFDKKKMLLADLGFNTVNYMPVNGGRVNMDKVKTNRDLGIQAAYKRIVNQINIDYNANFKFYEVDGLLDNGVPQRNSEGKIYYASIIDLSFVQDEFRAYAEQVWKDIYDKHEAREINDIEEVVFSGGTAERVSKHLLEVKQIYCSVLEDSQETQVRGYGEMALQRRLSRGE